MAAVGNVLRVFVALVLPAGPAASQQNAPPPVVAEYQFWSGTVTEVADGKVTVRRSSNNAEDRTFVVNAETKVEGQIKAEARVTVAYVEADGAVIAKRIVVRDK